MTLADADLSNDRKNPWLVIVVPICSDTEIDFLGKLIRLVRSRKLEDAVGNSDQRSGNKHISM